MSNSARNWIRFAATLLAIAMTAPIVSAHPMGNFSISHYAGIRVQPSSIELRYLIDMAEIPTFQEMQQAGLSANVADARLGAYIADKAAAFRDGLVLKLNGLPLQLDLVDHNYAVTPGAGNLPTLKFAFIYRAAVSESCSDDRCEIEYQDNNFADRTGWKEIVVSGAPGIILANSSAPTRDRSTELTDYPTDLLNSAPQDLSARFVYRQKPELLQAAQHAGRPQPTELNVARNTAPRESRTKPAAPAHQVEDDRPTPLVRLGANRQGTPRNAFTELINLQHIGWWVGFLAAAIAAGLGGLHALEPGHGKTIVAAYLVGSKGTVRHAVLLGLIVTASHTAGVYLLGAVTLYAQRYIMPERIYPLLAVLSGLLIAGMGGYLFVCRFVGADLTHEHGPGGHRHLFWTSAQNPKTGDDTGLADEPSLSVTDGTPFNASSTLSMRSLLLLGISGGIVPCPAALVVLLSAVALHRLAFGLFLIVSFSVGLAAVLIGMGMLAVCARRMMARVPVRGALVQRWLPMTSAAMITMLGCGITLRGLAATGILHL